MGLVEKLIQAYFDFAYNPVYDFGTGRLNLYHKLQRRCLDKLELRDSDNVLCVGCGTGSEILHILETNRNVHIVGVDYSKTALRKARMKALGLGKEIETIVMDARHLEFESGIFNKALCLHVMDFTGHNREVTKEILRVLTEGGQFVITYPSSKEGAKLGLNILKDVIRSNIDSGKHRVRALLESFVQMIVGLVYLPLILRPNKIGYSRDELEAMIAEFTHGDIQIEEDTEYQDFIVYGRK